jgi:hypothetical protein
MKKNFNIKFVSFAKILILFVKKTNDKLRLCVNYKELNEIIIKNRYSLFFISENLNKLFETKIFIKLNVKNVFHRIKIRKENEWKTTFKCRFDHYQYKVIVESNLIDKDWISPSVYLLNVEISVSLYSHLALIQSRQSFYLFEMFDSSTQNDRHQSKLIFEHDDLISSLSHCFDVVDSVISSSCLLTTLRSQMMIEMMIEIMIEIMISIRNHCLKIKLDSKLIIRWRNESRMRFVIESFRR